MGVESSYGYGYGWGDVVPSMAMVVMEGCTVGLTIMTKTVMAKGMSPYVFVVYSNALSSLILLLSFFTFHRPKGPFFTFSLLSKFFFLGLIGVALAQNIAFMGLSYSSPIVVATMANQLPAISFLLSIVLRTGKLDLRSTSSLIKVVGTLISISGAVFVASYKGPPLWNPSTPSHELLSSTKQRPLFLFASTPENWVLGCILLAVSTLCASIWNILQGKVVKEFPDATTIVTMYSLFGTIQCGIISLIAERDDLSAWKITSKMELINIVLAAVFGSVIRSSVQGWCMRKKGPQFIAMFKPFTIFIACSLGYSFFGHTFHFGSVVGSFIAAIGYYSMMWGQTKEEENSKANKGSSTDDSLGSSSNPTMRTPLLKGQDQEHEELEV